MFIKTNLAWFKTNAVFSGIIFFFYFWLVVKRKRWNRNHLAFRLLKTI